MSKTCIVCNKKTLFFVWGSSRNVDKNKLRRYTPDHEFHVVCVCMRCCESEELLIERPPIVMYKPRKYRTWDEIRREKIIE
jgi:hypothetical protein